MLILGIKSQKLFAAIISYFTSYKDISLTDFYKKITHSYNFWIKTIYQKWTVYFTKWS